jgi:glucosylglycerate synthase
MPRLESQQEVLQKMTDSEGADVLIGIVAPVNTNDVLHHGSIAMEQLATTMPSLKCVIAYPLADEELAPETASAAIRTVQYSLTTSETPIFPGMARSSSYKALEAVAADLGVSACLLIAPDLTALDAHTIQWLSHGILQDHCDLSVSVYSVGKFEALLNSSILSPMTRALYGKRIRFPLALDIGVSPAMLGILANAPPRIQGAASSGVRWPTVEAVRADRTMCQTLVPIRHPSQTEGFDLSSVLGGLLGSLFSEIESNAPIWQRVRGSHDVPFVGGEAAKDLPHSDSIDVRPLLESFQLGVRNLQEVWGLVLPPITLLELRRLTRLSADSFHVPDEMWVRIVYDFALAYRLRTISRVHILGAFTPLYLGWVASYVIEVGAQTSDETERRLDQLARAYEEGKPYLLSRWRWPDRFNP